MHDAERGSLRGALLLLLIVSAVRALFRNAMRPIEGVQSVLRQLASRPPAERPDPCGQVAQQRVHQMNTEHVEPLDLEALLGQ